ncbi:MAG: segregation and condensation protein A [Bacillota bacterium]|jgi:segregation and condensation protein A
MNNLATAPKLAKKVDYEVKLEVFEGPFELLLYLIDKEQMDIFDIPIAEITKQFVDHLTLMRGLNIEVTSNFLVMASNLLALKAKMLLPAVLQDEEELLEIADTKQMLIDNILYYKAVKEVSAELLILRDQEQLFRMRPPAEELFIQLFSQKNPLEGKDINDLREAYQKAIERLEEEEPILEIVPQHITLESRLKLLTRMAKEQQQGFFFSDVFAQCQSKNEMIVTFLALLELLKKGVLRVSQKKVYDDIYICRSAADKGDFKSHEGE